MQAIDSSWKPYGVDVVTDGHAHAVLFRLESLGVAHGAVSSLAACERPVAYIDPSSTVRLSDLTAWLSAGGVAIVPSTQEKGESHILPYSSLRTLHSPFVYRTERVGKGLLLSFDPAYVTMADGSFTAWHEVELDAGAPASVVVSPRSQLGELWFWTDILRSAFAHHGLPLVHRWFYPGRSRSHFTIRVDADWYDEKQWTDTLRVLEPLKDCMSWFLTMRDIDGHPALVDALRKTGAEIGSHAYWHYTFRDNANNRANMRRADEALRNIGIRPHSFVSPSSKWNPGLQRIIDELGYAYGSEFGLAYDSLPFRPVLGEERSSSLQVPVHAVSPGNFAKHSRPEAARVVSYYRRIAAWFHEAALPLHFYGHPSDLPVFAGTGFIEECLALPDVSVSSLGAYASWWAARSLPYAIRYRMTDGMNSFQSDALPLDTKFAVSGMDGVYRLADGSSWTMPKDVSAFGASSVISVSRSPFPATVRPMRRTQTMRARAGKWLDYEAIVPASAHRVSDMRTALNHIVKRLRGV